MLFVTTKKDKLFFFCHPQCLKISRLVYQNFDDQLAIILNWKFWSFFFLLYRSLWLAVQLYKKTTTKKCKTLSDLNIKFQQCDSIKLSKYFSVVGILTCTGISLFFECFSRKSQLKTSVFSAHSKLCIRAEDTSFISTLDCFPSEQKGNNVAMQTWSNTLVTKCF